MIVEWSEFIDFWVTVNKLSFSLLVQTLNYNFIFLFFILKYYLTLSFTNYSGVSFRILSFIYGFKSILVVFINLFGFNFDKECFVGFNWCFSSNVFIFWIKGWYFIMRRYGFRN